MRFTLMLYVLKKSFYFQRSKSDRLEKVIIMFLTSAVTFFKEPFQRVLQKAFPAALSQSVEPFILCTIHSVDKI